jgi:alpha-tubulin suppressor-like RCC1 family protein
VQVSGLTAVRAIAAGPASSFAVKSNGAVVAWGSGTAGTLGDGGHVNRLTPVAVPGLANVEQVAVAWHGIARTTAGEVWAWGPGSSGEMGNGTGAANPTPAQVPGLAQITRLAAGDSHCVAMKATGEVFAWGRGVAGEIGDGGQVDRWSPVAVSIPPLPVPTLSAVEVGAGEHSSFAIIG